MARIVLSEQVGALGPKLSWGSEQNIRRTRPIRGVQIMAEERGYSSDRRSGRDRRVKNDSSHLPNGIERRRGKERRSGSERRAGWLKIGRWHSVFPWEKSRRTVRRSKAERPLPTSQRAQPRDIGEGACEY